MPLVDQQRKIPLPKESAGLLMQVPQDQTTNSYAAIKALLASPFATDTLSRMLGGTAFVGAYPSDEAGLLGSVNAKTPNHIRMTLRGSGALSNTFANDPTPESTLAHETAHVAELTKSIPKEVIREIVGASGLSPFAKQAQSEAVANAVENALDFMRNVEGKKAFQIQDWAQRAPGTIEAYNWLQGILNGH